MVFFYVNITPVEGNGKREPGGQHKATLDLNLTTKCGIA